MPLVIFEHQPIIIGAKGQMLIFLLMLSVRMRVEEKFELKIKLPDVLFYRIVHL
jgi:hypothetical protein